MTIVHIFAPIAEENYSKTKGVNIHEAAAKNKVFALARAINSTKMKARVVASPIVTTGRARLIDGFKLDVLGIDLVYLSIVSLKGFNRVYSSFSYLFYLLKEVGKQDKVIIYNFFPEYILVAFVQFVRRNKVFMDIEDGPRKGEKTLRGAINRFSFFLLSLFCKRNKLVSNEYLNEKYSNQKGFVCYGVFDKKVGNNFRVNSIEGNSVRRKINILYGGSICKDTGSELFSDAIRMLAESKYSNNFSFKVTGFGNIAELVKLKGEVAGSIDLEIFGELKYADYLDVLSQCDVGLSLKLPDSEMGITTFPSKVVEIVSNGLLLLSTDVSDVSKIFSDDSAIILNSDKPETLFEAFVGIVEKDLDLKKFAVNGFEVLEKKMSVDLVGKDLASFLR